MYAEMQADAQIGFVNATTIYENEETARRESFTLQPNKKKLLMVSYIAAGTFGILTPQCVSAGTVTAYSPVNNIEEVADATTVASVGLGSAAQDILRIRETTKISISEIANTLGVSRQTVHQWIKGGAVSKRHAKRLSQLALVADVFAKSHIEVTPYAMRRPINGGPSVLEAVAKNGNAVELAQLLIKTLLTESQQQQRLALRLASRRANGSSQVDPKWAPSDETV